MNKKFVSPILMWFIILGGILLSRNFISDATVIPKNAFTPLLIIPASIYWVYFFFDAIHQNKRAALSADKVINIITTGIYGKVRHPIYSADILLSWALFFLFPMWWVLVSVLWLNIVMLRWIKLEEKALTDKFSIDYTEYKKRVPMLIPRLHQEKKNE